MQVQDPVQAIVEKPPTRVTMKSQTSAEIVVMNSKKCNADEKPDSVRMKNRMKRMSRVRRHPGRKRNNE
jgi:hypothetical protein